MKNIRLENFNIWINIIKQLYSLVLFGIILWFLNQFYFIYTQNQDIISKIVSLSFMDDKQLFEPIQDFLILLGKNLGFFIVSIVVYSLIKKIFRTLVLPSYLINVWNNTNQITPMFAHRLISYYTYNTHITIFDFLNIYKLSQIEAYTLSYNLKNKNLKDLFNRFDPDLVVEINIIDKYFPPMNLWQKIKTFFTGKPYRVPQNPIHSSPTPINSHHNINLESTIVNNNQTDNETLLKINPSFDDKLDNEVVNSDIQNSNNEHNDKT